jgi:hypothetical protein
MKGLRGKREYFIGEQGNCARVLSKMGAICDARDVNICSNLFAE